ncbi:MAG: HAD domain-containing protein [Verrucomicrobiales bacterium]|nr:HAD domain-containing protein [Verrucomicrobiales bacterium]
MKIIFLDFDGVIRIAFPKPDGKPDPQYCPERMQRVARLASDCGAKLVISSDWRPSFRRDEMIRLLSPHNPGELLHEDWGTPILTASSPGTLLDESVPRGAEILTWLARNPDTSTFVILDDMSRDRFPLMQENLVKCEWLEGFTEERLQVAGEVLDDSSSIR